jgi:hypothetical protein
VRRLAAEHLPQLGGLPPPLLEVHRLTVGSWLTSERDVHQTRGCRRRCGRRC